MVPAPSMPALLGLAYRGCPFGPFELGERGPTNPIVEIWGRQDGPALPLRGHVHGPSPVGPPLPRCVIPLHDSYAAGIRGPPGHHHVPLLIIAVLFHRLACTLYYYSSTTSALNWSDSFLTMLYLYLRF